MFSSKASKGEVKRTTLGNCRFALFKLQTYRWCWLKCWSILESDLVVSIILIWYDCVYMYIWVKTPPKTTHGTQKLVVGSCFSFLFSGVFSGLNLWVGVCSFESFNFFYSCWWKGKIGSSWKSLELFEILKDQFEIFSIAGSSECCVWKSLPKNHLKKTHFKKAEIA